jgi:hypothetical protein
VRRVRKVSNLKKLLIIIAIIASLTACGSATTQTVVVDQNGKVIANKKGLVYIGKLPVQGMLVDSDLYQDVEMGCIYMQTGNKFSPYYNANGEVDGCKNLVNKNKLDK